MSGPDPSKLGSEAWKQDAIRENLIQMGGLSLALWKDLVPPVFGKEEDRKGGRRGGGGKETATWSKPTRSTTYTLPASHSNIGNPLRLFKMQVPRPSLRPAQSEPARRCSPQVTRGITAYAVTLETHGLTLLFSKSQDFTYHPFHSVHIPSHPS